MKRKVNCQIADAGKRSLDHNKREPIVSLIHNQSDIRSLAMTDMRISVPSESGI